MNAKNLPLKFSFVALLISLCLWSLWANGLRQGIDLRGGHSLIFEIRTNEGEIKRMTADRQDLEAKKAQAATETDKKSVQEAIDRIDSQLSRYK
jgi:preprotein translocase subunit SecF